jgi:DNA repair exonuclease SbcCD ATPase subunit
VHLGRLRALVPALVLVVGGGGCLVMGSTFEAKTREADSLRDAVAQASRERNACQARNEALEKQLSDEKEHGAALSAKIKDLEGALRRADGELASARKNYEGTRITREQLVAELLEKEKATGKRIQELSTKVSQCEAESARIRKEAAAREASQAVLVADLRKKAEKTSEEESLRRERDTLLGRVERLLEERRQDERRRKEKFEALAEALGKESSEVTATVVGPALRVVIPETLLARQGKAGGEAALQAALEKVGKAAAETPSSSVFVLAGSRATADRMRAILQNGPRVPEERIVSSTGAGGRGAELFLLIP